MRQFVLLVSMLAAGATLTRLHVVMARTISIEGCENLACTELCFNHTRTTQTCFQDNLDPWYSQMQIVRLPGQQCARLSFYSSDSTCNPVNLTYRLNQPCGSFDYANCAGPATNFFYFSKCDANAQSAVVEYDCDTTVCLKTCVNFDQLSQDQGCQLFAGNNQYATVDKIGPCSTLVNRTTFQDAACSQVNPTMPDPVLISLDACNYGRIYRLEG